MPEILNLPAYRRWQGMVLETEAALYGRHRSFQPSVFRHLVQQAVQQAAGWTMDPDILLSETGSPVEDWRDLVRLAAN